MGDVYQAFASRGADFSAATSPQQHLGRLTAAFGWSTEVKKKRYWELPC